MPNVHWYGVEGDYNVMAAGLELVAFRISILHMRMICIHVRIAYNVVHTTYCI